MAGAAIALALALALAVVPTSAAGQQDSAHRSSARIPPASHDTGRPRDVPGDEDTRRRDSAGRAIAGGGGAARADRLRVCAGGDITLGTNLDSVWVRRMTWTVPDSVAGDDSTRLSRLASPEALIAPVRRLTSEAAVVLFNAEGAIGDGPVTDPKCVAGHEQCFSLRSPAPAARALRTLTDASGVVIANLANNHTHDAGVAGFLATTALLDSAGLLVTGVDTEPTVAVTAAGDTVAILGFSAWTDPDVTDTAAVRRVVARAAARFGRVVVTGHFGAEGRHAQRTSDSLEHFAGERRGNPVAFAHTAVDAGAGLVIGHGPHVLRAAEWRRGALIFYSLGNLVNYGPFGLGEPMDRGAVACASLDSAGRPHDVMLHPTRQMEPGVVRTDPRRRALALIDSLSRLDFRFTGASVDRVTGAVMPRTQRSRPARPDQAVSRRRRDR
jgi:poly-gamma-glutamate capsule biosynthesis protein CapA/YwtB (metallophosphatase superfamily)